VLVNPTPTIGVNIDMNSNNQSFNPNGHVISPNMAPQISPPFSDRPKSDKVLEFEKIFDQKIKYVEEMMKLTNQERDVCYFYLESTDWNVENAIIMFKNMTE
jgi:hypothetical protein